ncbi:MAG: type IV pilus assembly protein PilM [Phycisphaerae bacterium]|nr:type IV pilus assembly protein PilM [Phycisphaerae bacterium]
MPSSSTAWGVEIGASAIKGLKLVNEGDRLRVADFVVLPHPKPASSPDVDPAEVLRVGINTLGAQVDLSRAAVAVSVPGHMAFARFAKLPPVEPKKVPDIVRFEAMQQIPFPLEQVEWDYQTFVSPDSPDVEVGIFAITKERIGERLQMLGDAGIRPDIVTLSPIAVFNALAHDLEFTETSPGTVIVDIGTTSTDLVVADAGRMWIRTLSIGGHQFTQAIVDAFNVSYQKAERIKREAHDTAHAKQVFSAMRPVFTDLAQDIQRSIQYYQSLHKDTKLTRLIGVGSTFELPGLRKFLQQQVQMEVYKVEEFKKLGADDLQDPARREAFKGSAIGMVTAYGLALQALDLGVLSANVMPLRVLRRTLWKDKVKWFGLAAGLAIAGSAAMFIGPFQDNVKVQAASAGQDPITIQRVLADGQRAKTLAQEAGVVGGAQTDYRAANLAGLVQHRDLYARLVDDLGRMLDAADGAAATWAPRGPDGKPVPKPEGPAYELKLFDTTYEGGGLIASASVAALPVGATIQSPIPEELHRQPLVRIRLRVSTAQADPQRFMIATIQQWLRENRDREGVPYLIFADENPWRLADVSLAGGAGPLGRDPRMGSGAAATPGLEGDRRGTAMMPPRPVTRPGAPVIRIGDAAAAGSSQAGAADLATLAPLGSLRDAEVGAAATAVFDVEWTIVLRPKKQEGGA